MPRSTYTKTQMEQCARLILGAARLGRPAQADAIALAKMVLGIPGAIAAEEPPCGPVTADTITDEQILALSEACFEVREDGQQYIRDAASHEILRACNVATNGLFPPDKTRAARVRCAEIVNARSRR